MMDLTPLAWLAATLLTFAVPLWPAWRELRERHDAAPLAVEGLADWPLEAHLGQANRWPLLTAMPAEADSTDGLATLSTEAPTLVGRLKGATRLIAPLHVRALACDQAVTLEGGAQVSAVLVARSLTCLGQVLLPHVVEVTDTATLSPGCRFFRLKARHIGPMAPAVQAQRITGQTRLQSFGPLRLSAGHVLARDCVVHGDVVLEAGAQLIGSLKAHGRVLLENGAQVHGHLFAVDAIQLGEGAFVAGHVVSQSYLRVGAHSQLGTDTSPVTCTAPQIRLSALARVHGSLNATGMGIVR
ncbi:hypothetical protein [Comamonas serinivorans]|nr:hypothetical protein [Comamonas serinivorans]